MLAENVKSLLDTLDQEQACCERLIEVSREEQESLVQSDLDALGERIADMQQAVREFQELRANRRELLDRLAGHLALKPGDLSLQVLAGHLDGDSAEAVRARARELARTAEALYRLNQNTIYLISFSLDLVDRQIGAWSDCLVRKDGYDQDGQSKSQASEATILEKKV